MDITGVITQVADDSYDNKDFKVVTLGTGQTLKVKQGRDGALMAKWGLLKEGVAVTFKMKDFTNAEGLKFPFVNDIVLVADSLQPPTNSTILAEHEEVIQEAREAVRKEPSGQEVGLWWKEVGEAIRMGMIKNTGSTKVYWTAYWLQMSSVLNIKPEK